MKLQLVHSPHWTSKTTKVFSWAVTFDKIHSLLAMYHVPRKTLSYLALHDSLKSFPPFITIPACSRRQTRFPVNALYSVKEALSLSLFHNHHRNPRVKVTQCNVHIYKSIVRNLHRVHYLCFNLLVILWSTSMFHIVLQRNMTLFLYKL